jgi:23S rRNA (cytosine1962-C5)-methyltransferase
MSRPLPAPWTISHHEIHFELEIKPFGHVGVFPEQAANWDWIAQQTARNTPTLEQRLRILNLFAYTGGSTLAAAAAGAEVTHVDAARNIVAWARRNAELSGLSAAPIRWIVDDALKFVRRELKRGKRYDAVILDPPSYGHGSAGESWKLDDHLAELLTVCRELATPQPRFVLLTCHAPNYHPQRLAECLITAGFAERPEQIQAGDLSLCAADGRSLHAGVFARAAAMGAQPNG